LKNALTSMNSYLEERQESKVAYVGVTKAVAVENLLKAITDAKGIIEHIQAKHGITVSKSTISNVNCVLGHLKGRISKK